MSDLAWRQVVQTITAEDNKQQHPADEKAGVPPSTAVLLTPEQVFQVSSLHVGITCVRCKQKDVMYDILATRSADEGMTADCCCRNCHHRFRKRV
jgi:DNA-directed RNA polymerase subunit M/transcription elongation factor TFIIS